MVIESSSSACALASLVKPPVPVVLFWRPSKGKGCKCIKQGLDRWSRPREGDEKLGGDFVLIT